MQELAPAPNAMPAEDVAKLMKPLLTEAINSIIDPTYEAERLVTIARARNNIQFVKGNHFLAPDWVSNGTQEIVDWVSVDVPPSESEEGAQVKFMYPFNMVGGDCWKFVAVMGQSAPRVKAVADNLEDIGAEEMVQDVQTNCRDLITKWKVDHLQKDLAYHQWTTGPVYAHVRWVTNGQKYGTSTEPTIGIEEDSETGMHMPVDAEEQTYENGDVEITLYSSLFVEHDYQAKRIEDCGWLRIRQMKSKWELIHYFPQLADKKDNDFYTSEDRTASAVAAAEAIDGAANASNIGKPLKRSEWLWTQLWLAPWQYAAFGDKQLQEVLKTQFPNGVKIDQVGTDIVALKHEHVTEAIAVQKTGRGEYIMSNPLCHDSIPIQRAINDFFNLAVETILRSIPRTIVAANMFDRQALSQNEAVPSEVIFAAVTAGQDISKSMAQLPVARVSDQLAPLGDKMREVMVDINGIRPELSGGGEPTTTYREAKMRRDQAMLQLQPASDAQQDFWETAHTLGVKCRAKYGVGIVRVPSENASMGKKMDVSDMARLQETGWHIEAESGVPETWAERADKLADYIKNWPPEVQQILGILDPMNAEQVFALLRIDGFQSPLFDQMKKYAAIISELKQSFPVDDVDPATGQPKKSPSIMPEPAIDDPTFVIPFFQKWCNSEDGRQTKKNNEPGYENVKAYLMKCQEMQTQQQVAAQGAPPPGQGPGGGGQQPEGSGPAGPEPAEPGVPGPGGQPETPGSVPPLESPDTGAAFVQ